MRKNIMLFVLVALAIAAIFSIWGCGEEEEDVLTTISVSPSIATIAVDQSMEFTAKGYDQHGDEMSGMTFSWTSSNTTIATITSDGLATGHQVGNTSITVASEGVSGSADLTVISTPIYSIEISPSSAMISEGQTQQFTAVAKDSLDNNIPDSVAFLWESSNADIATIDEDGLSTGRSQGTTTITASAGDISGIASLEVLPPSQRGKISFVASYGDYSYICLVNEDGSGLTQLTTEDADNIEPAWHPFGQKIAFSSDRDGEYRIWVMNADGTNMEKLTYGPGIDKYPSYSPDGSQMVFSSNRTGNFELFIMNADGSDITQLTDDTHADTEPNWMGNGNYIVFTSDRSGAKNIWLFNLTDYSETQLTSATGSSWNDYPTLSPDGSLIAYRSAGYFYGEHLYSVKIMNIDGTNSDQTISAQFGGVGRPCFSMDGSRVVLSTVEDLGYSEDIYISYPTGECNQQHVVGTSLDEHSCVDHMVAW